VERSPSPCAGLDRPASFSTSLGRAGPRSSGCRRARWAGCPPGHNRGRSTAPRRGGPTRTPWRRRRAGRRPRPPPRRRTAQVGGATQCPPPEHHLEGDGRFSFTCGRGRLTPIPPRPSFRSISNPGTAGGAVGPAAGNVAAAVRVAAGSPAGFGPNVRVRSVGVAGGGTRGRGGSGSGMTVPVGYPIIAHSGRPGEDPAWSGGAGGSHTRVSFCLVAQVSDLGVAAQLGELCTRTTRHKTPVGLPVPTPGSALEPAGCSAKVPPSPTAPDPDAWPTSPSSGASTPGADDRRSGGHLVPVPRVRRAAGRGLRLGPAARPRRCATSSEVGQPLFSDPLDFSGVWAVPRPVPVRPGRQDHDHRRGPDPLPAADTVAAYVGLKPAGCSSSTRGLNPSGSFKDNGMTRRFTHARMVGARRAACASTGNPRQPRHLLRRHQPGCGPSSSSARHISYGKLSQALEHGALTVQIAGDFDDALRQVQDVSRPARHLPGQQRQPVPARRPETIMLRVLEALRWEVPVLGRGAGRETSATCRARQGVSPN